MVDWKERIKQMDGWSFGDTPEMADEIGELVVKGIKTATTSLLSEYEIEGEPLPKIGEQSFIKDSQGDPLCVIETTEVKVKTFGEVDEKYAFDEGEGDRSLGYWRKEHIRFFSKYCHVDENLKLVCERFKVIHLF